MEPASSNIPILPTGFSEAEHAKFLQNLVHSIKSAEDLEKFQKALSAANELPAQVQTWLSSNKKERDDFDKQLTTFKELSSKFESDQKEIIAFLQACQGKDRTYVFDHHSKVREILTKKKGLPVCFEKALSQFEKEIDAAMAQLPKALAEEVTAHVNSFANGKFQVDAKQMEEGLKRWGDWHKLNPDHPLGMRYLAIRPLGSGSSKNVQLVFDLTVKDKAPYAMGLQDVNFYTSEKTESEIKFLEELKKYSWCVQLHKVTHSANKEKVGLLFEYCHGDGRQLLELLNSIQDPKKQAEARMGVAKQLLKAVSQLNDEAQIYHRDIKRENIFYVVDQQGQINIKIGDLGEADRKSDKIGKGGFVGSPYWAGPEYEKAMLGKGGPFITDKKDAYSLGLVLHEILFKNRPKVSDWPPMVESPKVPVERELFAFYGGLPNVEESQKEESVAQKSGDISQESAYEFSTPYERYLSSLDKSLPRRKELDRWFPEPEDSSTFEHIVWRLLQPPTDRITATEALGCVSGYTEQMYLKSQLGVPENVS